MSTRARRSCRWTSDAFDVADIDDAATNFPDLNFIVEHCGMPRLDDFCWIAVQEPNVYGGLAVRMPFIHPRPDYFGDVMAELLFWLGAGPAALLRSDYALWSPEVADREVRRLRASRQTSRRTGVELTLDAKQKILGLNAAQLYDIDPVQHGAKLRGSAPARKASRPWRGPGVLGSAGRGVTA